VCLGEFSSGVELVARLDDFFDSRWAIVNEGDVGDEDVCFFRHILILEQFSQYLIE